MPKKGTSTSPLQRLLDNISRPGYAATGALKNIIGAAQGVEELDPLKAAAQGLSLKKKVTGSDVLSQVVGEAPIDASLPEKITRGVAGFGIDVAADPLNLLGIGALTKAGKVAKIIKGVGGLEKTGGAIKIGSKLARQIERMPESAKILGKTFAEQGARGQRALLSIGGHSLLGKKIDSAALGFMEKAGSAARNAPFIKGVLDKGEDLFSIKTGDEALDSLMHEHYGKIYQNENKVIEEAKSIASDLKGFSKVELKDLENYMFHSGRSEFMERVVPETGKVLQNVARKVEYSPQVVAMGERLKNHYGDMANTEIEKGILKDKLDGYIPGIGTKEIIDLAKKLKQKTGQTSSEFNEMLGFTKEKVITRELTPSQANSLLRRLVGGPIDKKMIEHELNKILTESATNSVMALKTKADFLGKGPVKKGAEFFVEDPALQYAVRGMKHVHGVANVDFLEKAKAFGRTEDEWVKLPFEQKPGWTKVNIPEFRNLRFPRRVANALTRHHEAMSNEKVVNDFLKTYKGMINFWKRWTLTPFSAYHVRNVAGNLWNNYITAGIIDPREYIRASKLQIAEKMAEKGNPAMLKEFKIMTDAGQEVSGEQLLKEIKQYGIEGSGRSSEVVESVANRLKGPNLNPASENFALIRGGRAVGDAVENNGKFTHYINRRIAGESPAQAAMSTKAALFDYGALTPFEKQYMRFIFPFWSWTKNNVPLQLKQLIESPGKFTAMTKAKGNIEAQAGTQDTEMKWMPEWMQDSFPIILDKMPEKERYKVFLLSSWLPAGDIDKLFNPLGMMASSIEPFSKEAMQQATNKDFYLQREIESYPGDVSSMLGIEMPARYKHALKIFRVINWLDQLNPGQVFGEYKKKPSYAGVARETIDLPMSERAVTLGTGAKIYPYDIKQGKTYMRARTANLVSKLRIGRKKAIKMGNESKARKIAEQIIKIQNESRGE